MKRYLVLLLILSGLLIHPLCARKKVAVVLSGGGAKGMAHVGALKVIERAGLPVDIVVGTSMGALVGSYYALGYSPTQLDSIAMTQNWRLLITDKIDPALQTLQDRREEDRYILSLPFSGNPKEAFSGGVIRGVNCGRMIWKFTRDYHDSISFDDLPIRFACVSQDVATGTEVVHRSGVLPIALRASMSLPGIFAPMYVDNKVLIDGGIVNNFPVDVARQMGADIVIGVDVQDTLKSSGELRGNIIAQLSQLIDLQGKDRWLKNIHDTDVYIKVNVKGYHTASFSTVELDSLIDRGERAAQDKWTELLAQRNRLGMKGEPVRPRIAHVPDKNVPAYDETQEESLHTLVGDAPKNKLDLGVRYDNEELAALIFNTSIRPTKAKRSTFTANLRLGKNTAGRLGYELDLGRSWQLATFYQLDYNDFNINLRGDRNSAIDYLRNRMGVSFQKSWRVWSMQLGSTYQNYDYGTALFSIDNVDMRDVNTESYFAFGGTFRFNSMDDAYFPTRGHDLVAGYTYSLPTASHNKPFHTAALHWQAAFSPHRRFAIRPSIWTRYVTTSEIFSEANTYGGQEAGKYADQQIPFLGLNRMEIARKSIGVVALELRQRFGKSHFVSVTGNWMATSDKWSHFFNNITGDDDARGFNTWGVALRYDMRTFIGPIGFTLHYSDRSEQVDAYVRAGFNF